MDKRFEHLVREVISGSYAPKGGSPTKEIIAKIEALWIENPALNAFYRLKGEKVTCGILNTRFISGMHVNVTRGHLIRLRKEFPKVTKEEVIEAVKRLNG